MDDKRKQTSDLTIFFIHPKTLVIYLIPVALTPPTGKSSLAPRHASMVGIDRVNIEEVEDLFWAAVYDN